MFANSVNLTTITTKCNNSAKLSSHLISFAVKLLALINAYTTLVMLVTYTLYRHKSTPLEDTTKIEYTKRPDTE